MNKPWSDTKGKAAIVTKIDQKDTHAEFTPLGRPEKMKASNVESFHGKVIRADTMEAAMPQCAPLVTIVSESCQFRRE